MTRLRSTVVGDATVWRVSWNVRLLLAGTDQQAVPPPVEREIYTNPNRKKTKTTTTKKSKLARATPHHYDSSNFFVTTKLNSRNPFNVFFFGAKSFQALSTPQHQTTAPPSNQPNHQPNQEKNNLRKAT